MLDDSMYASMTVKILEERNIEAKTTEQYDRSVMTVSGQFSLNIFYVCSYITF